MRRAWIHRLPLLALSGIALIASGGCLDFLNGNDEDDGDALPQDPQQLAILDDIATGVGSTTFDAAIGALQRLVEWSEGIPIALRSYSWDPNLQEWTLTETEDYVGGDAEGHIEMTWWVQFRANGTPQQQPDEATDQIAVRMHATNVGVYDPGEYQVAFDWTADHQVTGSRNPDNSASFLGNGSMNGTTNTTFGEQILHREQHVTWSHDFTSAPDEACVSGTFTGDMDPWFFDATFDGHGGYTWEIRRNADIIDSGFDEYTCAPQE